MPAPRNAPRRTKATPTRRSAVAAGLLLGAIAALLAMVVAMLPRSAARVPAAPGAPEPPAASRPPAEALPRPQPQPQPGAAVAAARREPPAVPARVAIVIDDVGYSLSELEPFLRIPGPLTIAVLPLLPHSAEAAERAHAAGKDVIVHMPMQPVGDEDPGPGAILVAESDQEIRSRVETALASVPYAEGLNNHMGSLAVTDSRVMGVVMDALAGRGLYFLDSRTTAGTVAAEAAAERGVKFLERSVFLDNSPVAGPIEKQLQEGLAVALHKGSAVMIGHVQNAATAEVLARMLPALDAKGFERVSLRSLLP